MNCDLVLDVHLVKLINTAYAIVSQQKSACLNRNVTAFLISNDTGCESCRCRSLSVRVNRARNELVDTFQKLGFSCRGIPDDQNVNVPSKGYFALSFLVDSPQQLQQKGFLNLDMSKYLIEKGLCQMLINPRILSDPQYVQLLVLIIFFQEFLQGVFMVPSAFQPGFVLFCFFFCQDFLIKLVVHDEQIGAHKTEFISEFFDALDAVDSVLHSLLPSVGITGKYGCTLPGFEEGVHIGNHR